MGKGTEPSDGVVEWYRNLNRIGDQILQLSEHGQVVLGLDIIWVYNVPEQVNEKKTSDVNF